MSARSALMENKKSLRTYYLVIFLLALLLYGNSIGNGYAIDDNYVTATGPNNPNPKIQKGIAGIPQIFSSHYFETEKQSFEYRPVVLTTYAIEYQFFGINPKVSHFINLLLYGLTGALLFSALMKFNGNASVLFPFVVTVLFVVHPVHTEVVDNLKSRDELLSFLFGILSVRVFFDHANKRDIRKVIVGVVCLLLALLCKITALLFVALIPIVLYFFSQQSIKKVLFVMAAAVVSVVVYMLAKRVLVHDPVQQREYAFFENPLFCENSWGLKLPLALYSAGYYIRLLVLPHPLSCYYGFNAIPIADWSMLFVWVALAFHVWLAVLAWKGLRQRSALSFGILVYFLGLLPFLQIKNPVVGIVGERFIYFSSLGFCIVLAHLLFKWFKVDRKSASLSWTNMNRSFNITSIVILLLCTIKVVSRNQAWKDELTLFRTDVERYPNSCNLNYITANSISNQIRASQDPGRRSALISEATLRYRKTAELMAEGLERFPNDYITLNNLGAIYVDVLQEPGKAQPLFKRAKMINPSNQDAAFNYAFCYERRSMPDSAMVEYEKLVGQGSVFLPVFTHLQDLYVTRKDYKKAISVNAQAIKINPARVDLYINAGNSYMLLGDTLKGLEFFEEAAKKAPSDPVLLQKVSDVFKVVGDTAKARKYASMARSL